MFQSLASIAIFGLLLLVGNAGLVAGSVNDWTDDGDATSTYESGTEVGTCSSNGDTTSDTIFAPLLEKPTELFSSSRSDIRLVVRRWIPVDEDVKSLLIVHHGGCGWRWGGLRDSEIV